MKIYTNILGRTISAFLLFFLVPFLLYAQETLSTASSKGFTKRMFHSSIVAGGKLYTIGGITDLMNTKTTSKSFEVYDPNTDTWDTILAKGTYTPRYGATSETIGGKVYLIGGADSNDIIKYTLDVFDIAKNEWKTQHIIGAFSPSFGATSAVVNGKIYFLGGSKSIDDWEKLNKTVQVLDTATYTWNTISTSGTFFPRRGATSVVYNDKIYLIGGYDGTNYSSRIDVFDPRTNRWTSPTFSGKEIGYSGSSACVLEGKVYVFGGNANNYYPPMVRKIDPLNNTISTPDISGSFFTARTRGTANVIGNKIYVVGGYDGTEVIGDNEVFSLQPNSVRSNYERPKMYLSPNPSSSMITLHNIPENILHLSVVNVLGESVMELINPRNENTTFELSNLVSGVYFLRVFSASSTSTLLFTKE